MIKTMVESKLRKYNGYIKASVTIWKLQIRLPEVARKILKNIQILSSREIRDLLRGVVEKNKRLFDDEKCFITKFGYPGKSGDILIYEFRHTFKQYKDKIIELWEIPDLPDDSKIIFIDDLIGTGDQSVRYITKKLNSLLNPSYKTYLMCLCATPQGLKKVKDNTNTLVLSEFILEENSHQYLNDKCKVFTKEEKEFLEDLNGRLHSPAAGYGNLGLLIAFYFTVPNNTLPFIWKDKIEYIDHDKSRKRWFALLPREY